MSFGFGMCLFGGRAIVVDDDPAAIPNFVPNLYQLHRFFFRHMALRLPLDAQHIENALEGARRWPTWHLGL
jgi:hypothetical protein